MFGGELKAGGVFHYLQALQHSCEVLISSSDHRSQNDIDEACLAASTHRAVCGAGAAHVLIAEAPRAVVVAGRRPYDDARPRAGAGGAAGHSGPRDVGRRGGTGDSRDGLKLGRHILRSAGGGRDFVARHRCVVLLDLFDDLHDREPAAAAAEAVSRLTRCVSGHRLQSSRPARP